MAPRDAGCLGGFREQPLHDRLHGGEQAAPVEGLDGGGVDAFGLDDGVGLVASFDDEHPDPRQLQFGGEHQANRPGACDEHVVVHRCSLSVVLVVAAGQEQRGHEGQHGQAEHPGEGELEGVGKSAWARGSGQ